MGERRIINGAIYEMGADGVPRLVPNAPVAGPTAVPLPVNPVTAARQAMEEARKDRTEGRVTATAERQNRLAEERLKFDREKSERDERRADRLESGGALPIKDRNALIKQRNGLDEILKTRIDDLETQYKESFGGFQAREIPLTTGVSNILPRSWEPKANTFNSTGASLMGELKSALGLTGGEANSVAEVELRFGPLIPKASDSDEEVAQKIKMLRAQLASELKAVDLQAQNAGIQFPDGDGQRAENEVPGQDNGAPTKPDVVAADGTVAGALGLKTDTRFEDDPRAKSKIDSLISAGAWEAANATLRKAGKDPISPIERQQIEAWQKANPGKAYTGSQIGREVPLTAFQSLAGSPLGAGAARFANGATAGLVGNLGGDKAQGALDAMAAANPRPALAGDILGGVLGAFGAEAGAAAALGGRGAAWLAPRLGDAAYGGLSGFNAAQDGEGAMGAMLGAGAGVAGGALGQFGANQIGRAVRGVRDPNVQYLRGRGVPLTVGQTVGNSGRLGQVVDGVEEAMTSIPGVGNMVDARRMDGLQAWNRAAMQDAAAPGANITATGAEGMGQVRQSVSDAYDNALGPARIDVNDPQYVADVAAAQAAAQGIPNVQPTMPSDFSQASLTNRLGVANPTGQITGRDFQEAYRGLARDARGRVNSDYGHEVGQVARQGQEALADVLERQNPGAFDGFLEANAANRRANVMAQAMNPNAVDELVTPAQLGRADFNSTSRLTNRVNAASGNRPFYDLTSAGQSVLPSRLPDSGTAKRAIVGALTTGTLGGGAYFGSPEGAATAGGGGAILAAALALGGTRGGQRILTSALADRPDLLVDLGTAIGNRSQYGGILGAATATPLAIGQ